MVFEMLNMLINDELSMEELVTIKEQLEKRIYGNSSQRKEKNMQCKIRISEWNGFYNIITEITLTEDELDIYINDYGVEFLKYDGKLYLRYKNHDCFERVITRKQIDEAFNPDRAAFERWRKDIKSEIMCDN